MLIKNSGKRLWRVFPLILVVGISLFEPLLLAIASNDAEPGREQAQFKVLINGQEIGEEKFSIETSGDTVNSHSIANFRNLGPRRQKVQMESQLSMDRQYLPQKYQIHIDFGGQTATVQGTFGNGEADFEYLGSSNPRKRGLLVGERFIVLDTNVFHHFIFVVRLFDFSATKRQTIEVVIPQELDGGVLKVEEIGIEKVEVAGKMRELHHLIADSGLLQIDLWADDQRILYKIAVPVKGIEVIRKS